MKSIAPGFILALLALPIPAGAVLLDCEINAQRIYTCVEVGESATAAETADGTETYGDEYRPYLEQAKQQCVYRKPRRRVAGKNTGGALRSEELKAARAEYEQCVSETARELWRSNDPPGASAPGQDK
jgi:hypothetical protein